MANGAQKHVFAKDNREYYYWTEGQKDNPWVLLIPGFTSTHSDLLPLAQSFKENYFVIIPDLPGWGKSSPLPSKLLIENYAKFLHELMISLGDPQIYLVGYCLGAAVGLTYTLKYPEKIIRNIFISTPYMQGAYLNKIPFYCAEIAKHTPKSWHKIFYLWRNRWLVAVFAFFTLHTKSLSKKLHMIRRSLASQYKENTEAMEENWTSLAEYSFENLQKISTPVHLIHGDSDLLVPLSQAKKFQKLFQKASLDVIRDSGHWIPAEKPQTLGSVVVKYLSI